MATLAGGPMAEHGKISDTRDWGTGKPCNMSGLSSDFVGLLANWLGLGFRKLETLNHAACRAMQVQHYSLRLLVQPAVVGEVGLPGRAVRKGTKEFVWK